jgi:hypothetical protein
MIMPQRDFLNELGAPRALIPFDFSGTNIPKRFVLKESAQRGHRSLNPSGGFGMLPVFAPTPVKKFICCFIERFYFLLNQISRKDSLPLFGPDC